jgi:hypothetical protein
MGADGGNGKRGSAERLESSHGLFSLFSRLVIVGRCFGAPIQLAL